MPDLYSEPALHRMLFRERTKDVEHYRRLVAEHGAPVLELGVGDGRIALALADDGHEVVGVDRSTEMLHALEAHRRGRSVTGLKGDMRSVRIDRRFPTVICAFNGFAHCHDHESQTRFLETVKLHLEDGGVFAFDVLIPDPAQLAGRSSFVARVEHPRTGVVCRMEEHYAYDTGAELLTITTRLVERLSGDVQELTLSLKQLHPQQTERMLAFHGFELLQRTASIGDSLAYVCRIPRR